MGRDCDPSRPGVEGCDEGCTRRMRERDTVEGYGRGMLSKDTERCQGRKALSFYTG